MRRPRNRITFVAIMCALVLSSAMCSALQKEKSLITGKRVGKLAVADRLNVDLHADFMMSRTFERKTVLNWYNCGVSGGGRRTGVGGTFGNFGLQVPHEQRAQKYPKAVTVNDTPAASFDGDDYMKANFAAGESIAGNEDMALEVWVLDEDPDEAEVILGWQSREGSASSAVLTYPQGFEGSSRWRHIVVNCSKGSETRWIDGQKMSSSSRSLNIKPGHRMVLGGASEADPSFEGKLAAVRVHRQAMSDQEIAQNYKGGVMLGTKLHNWWRTDNPDKWWTAQSDHFRHCVKREKFDDWSDGKKEDFRNQVEDMFEQAEELYRLYGERSALRMPVVPAKPAYRGDGIKYRIPIQPADGSYMGWNDEYGLGYSCQPRGHINPHELVHGCQAQTGGCMTGYYWEAHANYPQTYAGIYQTVPPKVVTRVSVFYPANGRCYYHARLMFEHLSQAPEYGPMFISKLWYDGGTEENKNEYPWTAFKKFDPDPSTGLGYEWTRMVQKCITWDYEIFDDDRPKLYKNNGDWDQDVMRRYGHVMLQEVPYKKNWWRPPKEMTPQQLGYNICPLQINSDEAEVQLKGYVNEERGGDWRLAFVGVKPGGEPVYGKVGEPGEELTFDTTGLKELYIVVSAVPTKIMPINLAGDFRSFAQEKFPYRLKLEGCKPLDTLLPEEPSVDGGAHSNGGGFVAESAEVDDKAYVGPNARVLGDSKVMDNARVEDYAVVRGSTVKNNAIISGHALVKGSTVKDNARVRDRGRVYGGSTVQGSARILEHATHSKKKCGGNAVLKGVAHADGNISGTPMIDGLYRKTGDVDKGKWFQWSWGHGKESGEVDKEFGGLYTKMTFKEPHDWMARDDFGATWGYLVGDPKWKESPKSALQFNGRDQFVELPDDVADMRDMSIRLEVNRQQSGGNTTLLDYSNSEGDHVWLGMDKGSSVFALHIDGHTQMLKGPALPKGAWTELEVVLSGDIGRLFINGEQVARNPNMSMDPEDVKATECYLARSRQGEYFAGQISKFVIHSAPLPEE